MNKELIEVKKMVGNNNLAGAITALLKLTAQLPDENNQVMVLSAKIKDINKKENLGVISFDDAMMSRNQVSYALLQLATSLETVFEENAEKKVFISYNHADAAVANKIKDTLRAEEIEVTIDSEKMAAGEDIKAFIEKCVRETDITLSVVSKKSLLSAWVAMESMNTFYLEKGTNSKKFIPCYIDPEFFNHSFTDNAIDETDAKLELLDSLFAKRIEQKQGIDDIDDERARLLDLKHNMDKIIGRLRNSLCVDIREENFEPGMKKIIQTIKE